MNTTNRIQIAAPFERLFALAADIVRWPDVLPHYRYVKILKQSNVQGPKSKVTIDNSDRQPPTLDSGPRTLDSGLWTVVAEMAARHRGIPLWWRTIQRPKPSERRIEFTHIAGITKGMEVQWTFDEVGNSCGGPVWLVQIHHQFSPPWTAIGRRLADQIIGKMFVFEVANKTLKKMKEISEQPLAREPVTAKRANGPTVL